MGSDESGATSSRDVKRGGRAGCRTVSVARDGLGFSIPNICFKVPTGGRVKMLEREDAFTLADTQNCLCMIRIQFICGIESP